MSDDKVGDTHFLQYVASPIITTVLGLIAGVLLAGFNSEVSRNKFFLEKQAKAADEVAIEFSVYVENWARLMRLRREFDARNDPPSSEERENFKKVVFARSDARDRLFAAMDAVHLYFDTPASELALQFKSWDAQQAVLTIEQLPPIERWRDWQVAILRKLHEEIRQ